MELQKCRFPNRDPNSFQDFPLAFGISTYHQVGILELFLASSFHPLDSYCIHVDAKAKDKVKTAIDQLVGCYQWKYPEANIFTVDDPVAVFWGHISVLEADFKCMRLLRDNYKDWNLFLNLAGTELPLKPMPEIRRILKNFPDGTLESYAVPSYQMKRFKVSMELKRIGQGDFDLELVKTDRVKDLPPGNITLRKGYKNVALPPYLVDFFLDSPYCHEFLNWISDTHIPDEHFYSTMITKFNQTTRDVQDLQDLDTDFTHGVCLRLTWWSDGNCRGKSIRGICNFGQEDLPRLHKDTKCLFGNKFNLDVDAVAPMQHILHVLET
ncbi:beta-1,3-galactosyl-O-glycosyl-glycoprotein beta-1,6-N-acetylglucosaminyltransferase 4-like [Tigriopus californicus]|uniref:beta-1,3-galactosyl-O-glycosyl-glycoprotein beta-1,6-N-acetylglucosaminyltransferase 4-like n=1 Tax=Tigriopus californicus TaxID=6832 RepID=UPI0027DA160D|nr:beta-1,3-galactosyl-O-glycosyl-glycoprotein beta-1,6-N-acetylglucosaminyltransferase 4-like [Tigriopus californicus]